MSNFNLVKKRLAEENIKILLKHESILMKIFSYLLFFNRRFMTNYITIIGSTIYFPQEKLSLQRGKDLANAITLLHEYVHFKDKQKDVFFSLKYLFPQILFLLIIPFYFLIGLYSLLFILFLLPLPAYYRYYYEVRGYKISIAGRYWAHKRLTNFSDEIIDQKMYGYIRSVNQNTFKSSSYYFMWPYGAYDILSKYYEDIKNDKLDSTLLDELNFTKNMVDDFY